MTLPPRDLLRKIHSLVGETWTAETAVEQAVRIEKEIPEGDLSRNDLVGATLDLAVSGLSPLESNESVVRRFCGTLVVLTALSFKAPFPETTYKSVVSTIHVLIDTLFDYSEAAWFCSFAAASARRSGQWNVAIVATGDLGIATMRAGTLRDALGPLGEAVELGVAHNDICAAARYGSELGRCHFELGDRVQSRAALEAALLHSSSCDDESLRAQIRANLSVLGTQ